MAAPAIDIAAITPDLWEGYWHALDSVSRERQFLSRLEAPPREGSRAFVMDNIARGNPHLVAIAEGIVVGWCDICRSDGAWSSHVGSLGMGVVRPWRGQGIGLRLIGETVEAARLSGFERVELEVYASNARAMALYEKVGFEVEGRRRRAVLRDGVEDDVLIMGLLLT